MDLFKKFLDDTIKDREEIYRYDKLDNIAEIFKKGDIIPIAQVEWNKSIGFYIIRFRLGLQTHEACSLAREMTLANSHILFDEDFIIHEQYGYLYGEDARKAFIERIQNNVKNNNNELQDSINSAFYICQEPIFAFGSGTRGRTKIEKLLNFDFEDEE